MSSVVNFFQFPVAIAAVLFGTLWGGWLHGRMVAPSGRNSELLGTAVKRLKEPVAERHGNWRMVKEIPFTDDVLEMLQNPAYINRSYMHQQTGDVVLVTVIVGTPGPVSVHTPEVCYGSQNFAILGDRSHVKVVDREKNEHSFWQVSMEAKNSAVAPQTVLYAWSTGDFWSAVSDPRLAHAGGPYLYKIQLAGPPSSAKDEFKAWEDFLQWFLPDLEANLISTNRDLPTANDSTKR